MRTSSATLIAGATVSAVAAALWMNKHRPWSREEKGRTAPQLDNRYVGAASGRPAGSPVPSYHAPESGFGRMEEEQDRGRRPHIDRSGEVHGSGAGAGGGNPGEDFDDDPMSGGGDQPYHGSKARAEGERPKDRHQGTES
ncbi:MAG TPA: hypothetical protein VIR65_11510 [Rhizorhapis sp.]